MKKIVFLVLVWCAVITGVMAQGEATVTRFNGKPIRGLDVSGAWEIRLTQGNETKATLTFPERYEKQLVFVLEADGILKIGFHGEVRIKSGEQLVAEVICSSLDEIDLSGACKVKGTGKFTGNGLDIELSGASQVSLEDGITIVNGLKMDLSGAAKAVLNVTAQKYDVELSGASGLVISGAAETAKIEASGASKIDFGKAEVRRIELDLSGASMAHLNATELISGDISGASKVIYSGSATTRIDVSGAASLKHN